MPDTLDASTKPTQRMKTKPTKNSLRQFEYYAQCEDSNRLPAIPLDTAGYSAVECFHVRETYGKNPPCREPELLSRALNGKEQHGLSVTHCAEDCVGRILFASDLKTYPEWVRKDILGRARQLAQQLLGWVPTFVRTGEDFSTL